MILLAFRFLLVHILKTKIPSRSSHKVANLWLTRFLIRLCFVEFERCSAFALPGLGRNQSSRYLDGFGIWNTCITDALAIL